MLSADSLQTVTLVFLAFCFAASAIYCLNDIIDVGRDRKHPLKRHRPIASGAISMRTGYVIMFACLAVSFALSFAQKGSARLWLIGIIGAYIAMNIAYCLKLKQYAILDVFIIALGFVLRVFAGGVSARLFLSHWIILLTFLLALFLAFAKRRDDVVIYQETGVLTRGNIVRYNLAFLNQVVGLLATITIVCYIMYCVSEEVMERLQSHYVYLTSVFVLAGLIRYLQLTIVDVKSGSPTKVLLKDRFTQLCIVGWIISFILIMYL